jgi:hypothetical protein
MIAATSKLFIFIGVAPALCELLFADPAAAYLLRHQTDIPVPITMSGIKSKLVIPTHRT